MNDKNIENTVSKHIVRTVELVGRTSLGLQSPLAVPGSVSDPWTVCRMAVPRLRLKSLERLVLSLFVEDAFVQQRGSDAAGDVCSPYSYAGIGESVGKCAHSAKSAVAALRKAGLLVTSRSARSGENVCVSVRPFVAWGAAVCASRLGGGEVFGNSEQPPEKAEKPVAPRKRPSGRSAKRQAEDAPKKAEAAVAPPARGYDDCDLGPVGPGSDEPFLMEFGPEVDASAEREATLRAAGRTGDEDSDEITFGSDTADSDIGTGIEINMDL